MPDEAMPMVQSTPMVQAPHLLLIGEQGRSFKSGTVAIYTAPFNGKPQVLEVNSPIGETIAPNGALIAADQYKGIWVFDPPWHHKRLLFKLAYPSGQFLFDSKKRLIVGYLGNSAYVFDPPYKGRPTATLSVPTVMEELAVDSHDNVFVSTEPGMGGAPTYECAPPYYPCAKLPIDSGAAAITSSNDLLAEISPGTLAEYPPPYNHPHIKVNAPIPFGWITRASGATFLAGAAYGKNYFGVYPSTIGRQFLQLPVEQYFIPSTGYAVARNRELFVSDGTWTQPYVSIYEYPYSHKARKTVRAKYQIMSVFAQ